MKKALVVLAAGIAMVAAGRAQPPPVPFPENETLHYTVNYPSGLSLGETELSASAVKDANGAPTGWKFRFQIDAAFPGYRVKDEYRSSATPALCSLEFDKDLSHGNKRTHEKTTFDQARKVARRETLGGGGVSEIATGTCAMDGLTFLYYLRRELSRGRIPAPRTIFFGAAYQVRFQFTDTTRVRLHGKVVEADRLTASVKGPVSESTFLIEVARDTARTPVRITIPLAPGNFLMVLTGK